VATDTPVEAKAKTLRGQGVMDLIENLGKPVMSTATRKTLRRLLYLWPVRRRSTSVPRCVHLCGYCKAFLPSMSDPQSYMLFSDKPSPSLVACQNERE
jgi:hypothetical protein